MVPFAALILLQGTPSFIDILKSMHADYRKLTGFHETWTMKTEEGEAGVLMERSIDGKLFRTEASQGGAKIVEQGYDGKNSWYVSYRDREFALEETKNVFIDEPFSEPKFEGAPGINFMVSGGYDFSIAVSPQPVVSKIENVQLGSLATRRVSAVVNVPNRPKPATLQLWFDRDAWILRRIEARWKGQDGKDHFFVGAGTIQRNVKFKPGAFAMSPGSASGFTRKPLTGIGG